MKKLAFGLIVIFLLAIGALYLIGRFAKLADNPLGSNRPETPKMSVCTADAKLCDDGSSVGRDATNGCAFFECPKKAADAGDLPVACTMDARICADGSAVGRDGARGCAFAACPGEGTVSGTVTLAPICPYETTFDKPCPTEEYEGDLRIAPEDGGEVTVVQVSAGKFYATLPAGTYRISSGRVLPRCDETFTVTEGVDATFSASCDSGIR